jgi:exopolysaccharide biosynthesis protein
MADEFVNFLIFYLILSLMFVLIGTLMFMFYCDDFSTIFNSFITVTNAAMGNFFFSDFDQIQDNDTL